MNQIERYCDKELILLGEFCKELCLKSESRSLREITKIALIEINRELDERKIKMAGEHILKLLVEENARIAIGDRWMYCNFPVRDGLGLGMEYTVFERKPCAKKTKELIVTDDEELACRVLKSK